MTNEPEPNTRAGEALPCPWCSGKGFAQSPSLGHSSWRVICDDCCAEGPTVPSYNVDDPEAFCIIAWNNRIGNVAMSTWDHYAEEHVDTRPLPQPSELVETPEAFNKKKERCLAYVEQHWKWGNLTRLGIVNQLVRDGFRQTWAIEQADRIAPAANQAVAHITQLEAQIAKLQAVGDKLAGFTYHRTNCPASWPAPLTGDCTCGLTQALTAKGDSRG